VGRYLWGCGQGRAVDGADPVHDLCLSRSPWKDRKLAGGHLRKTGASGRERASVNWRSARVTRTGHAGCPHDGIGKQVGEGEQELRNRRLVHTPSPCHRHNNRHEKIINQFIFTNSRFHCKLSKK